MSGKQYTQLVRALDDRLFNQEEGEASREINAFAGVADVVTARTQGDEARFDKRNAVRSRYIAAKKELARQGKSYSPRAETVLSLLSIKLLKIIKREEAISQLIQTH